MMSDCATSFVIAMAFLLLSVSNSYAASSDFCGKTSYNALSLGVDWLVNGQDEDGLYAYEVLPFEEQDPEKNNIVRQIGAFWALVRMTVVDDRPEIRQSINLFRHAILSSVKRGKSADGEIAYIEYNGIGKLNSSALYLLALASMKDQEIELLPDERDIVPLLINGLKQMAGPNGGFWYVYYLSEEDNRITPYGSAEALYALAMQAHVSDDQELKEYALRTFKQYYDHYLRDLGQFENTLYRAYFSWALHAQPLLGDKDEASRYKNYIRPMLETAMKHRANNSSCAGKGCIMTPSVGDAPFLEGIVSAYPIAKRYEDNKQFLQEMEDYVLLALSGIVALQITPENKEMIAQSVLEPDQLIGGFCSNKECGYMRNDLNQHAMIAILNYMQYNCP